MFAFNITAVLTVQSAGSVASSCVRADYNQLSSPCVSLPAASSQQSQCFCKPHMFKMFLHFTTLHFFRFNIQFYVQLASKKPENYYCNVFNVFIVQVKSNK